MNIPHDAIETAYSFFHQKQRIYQFSTLSWQKDDIEMAISDYVESMNEDLYATLAKVNPTSCATIGVLPKNSWMR